MLDTDQARRPRSVSSVNNEVGSDDKSEGDDGAQLQAMRDETLALREEQEELREKLAATEAELGELTLRGDLWRKVSIVKCKCAWECTPLQRLTHYHLPHRRH